MSGAGARAGLKRALGGLPFAGRAYQDLLAGERPPASGFALERLQAALSGWLRAVEEAGTHTRSEAPRRLLVIGAQSWWIEYSAALGLLLSAAGHHVELATVPYRRWMAPAEAFDVDRQRAYLARTLAPLSRRIRLQ